MARTLHDLDDAAWPLHTERLAIRRFAPGDASAVWRYRHLPAVSAWMVSLDPDPEAFAVKMADPHRLDSTLVVEVDGTVVGDLYLGQSDSWAQTEVAERAIGTTAEIGWAFDPTAQGKGLASEAATALLGLCFDTLGVHRVTAVCFADNEPSWRLMERLGLRRESHAVADALHRDGRWLDSLTYAMLEHEWRERRDGDVPGT